MNAVITGASVGIGYNLALKLANLGYDLYLTYYNNQTNILKLKEEIENETKVKCYINKLDLKNEQNIIEVCHDILTKFSKINILVNNASISNDNLFLDKTKEEFMQVLEVNVVGTFLMTKYLIENIKDFVINMSSTDGIDTYSIYNLDYAISKSAIIQLTKSMSLIFPNIKTIAIAPNWVETESTLEIDKTYLENELKRIGQEKLISIDTVSNKIIDIIKNNNIKSGEVIKIYE
ncbi:MAG: SDR family oxidoreductase [Erysipelotrichaceae bacterium]|nr:SDR family oxidoreductase [Erysipelotrichaceae bacterium]